MGNLLKNLKNGFIITIYLNCDENDLILILKPKYNIARGNGICRYNKNTSDNLKNRENICFRDRMYNNLIQHQCCNYKCLYCHMRILPTGLRMMYGVGILFSKNKIIYKNKQPNIKFKKYTYSNCALLFSKNNSYKYKKNDMLLHYCEIIKFKYNKYISDKHLFDDDLNKFIEKINFRNIYILTFKKIFSILIYCDKNKFHLCIELIFKIYNKYINKYFNECSEWYKTNYFISSCNVYDHWKKSRNIINNINNKNFICYCGKSYKNKKWFVKHCNKFKCSENIKWLILKNEKCKKQDIWLNKINISKKIICCDILNKLISHNYLKNINNNFPDSWYYYNNNKYDLKKKTFTLIEPDFYF